MGADWYLYTDVTFYFKDGTSVTKQVNRMSMYFEDYSLSSSEGTEDTSELDSKTRMNNILEERYKPCILFQNKKWMRWSIYRSICQRKIERYIKKHHSEVTEVIESYWGELRG